MKIVADTNLLVAGLVWPGHSARVLDHARAGRVQIYSSQSIVDELRDVLLRPRFAKHLARFSLDPATLMEAMLTLVSIVPAAALDAPVCRDPDDDAVLATAVAATADAIVTGDADLLAIQAFRGIPIVTPASFIAQLDAARGRN